MQIELQAHRFGSLWTRAPVPGAPAKRSVLLPLLFLRPDFTSEPSKDTRPSLSMATFLMHSAALRPKPLVQRPKGRGFVAHRPPARLGVHVVAQATYKVGRLAPWTSPVQAGRPSQAAFSTQHAQGPTPAPRPHTRPR